MVSYDYDIKLYAWACSFCQTLVIPDINNILNSHRYPLRLSDKKRYCFLYGERWYHNSLNSKFGKCFTKMLRCRLLILNR